LDETLSGVSNVIYRNVLCVLAPALHHAEIVSEIRIRSNVGSCVVIPADMWVWFVRSTYVCIQNWKFEFQRRTRGDFNSENTQHISLDFKLKLGTGVLWD